MHVSLPATRECRTCLRRLSRNHVDKSLGRVRRPRYFLIYRFTEENQSEIGRVLHDSMDLPSHLPVEYRASSDADDGPGKEHE